MKQITDEILFKKIAILDGLTRENITKAVKQHTESATLGQLDPGIPITVQAKPTLLSTINRGASKATPLQTSIQIHAYRETDKPEALEIEGRIKFLLAPYKSCKEIHQWYQYIGHCYPDSTREKKGSIEVAYRLVEAEIQEQ